MKKEMQEKLDAMNASLRRLQGRVDLRNAQTKQEVESALTEAEGECNRLAENLRLQTEEKKSHLYSELLKAQMNYRDKKRALREDLDNAEFATEKAVARRDALDAIEYAKFLVDLANYAAQDANVAVLEAQRLKMEYEERYGELPEV